MNWSIIAGVVQLAGVLVGISFACYTVAGGLGSILYQTERSDSRVEKVRFAVPTVASENVRSGLMETLDHLTTRFAAYEAYCIVDEGSDLLPELRARDDITTVVVPDAYDCDARAKGRAMNYFVETVVTTDPDYWYAFLDDDNIVLDEKFLYEIPHYESQGYRAMNPVIKPRPGRSLLTFMADHIRLLDDCTIYRLFTGLLGRPYLGFHGELLCVRGDVLRDITFDRETIVEDFAFALELLREDVPVWQSRTRVSVLSPHDLSSFFQQRSRWFVGVTRYLPHSPALTKLVVGSRILVWTASLTSSWLLLPLWFGIGLPLPLWLVAVVTGGSLIYITVIGYGAVRIGGIRGFGMFLLFPLYATLEHLTPLYAISNRQTDFVVIEK
jgi:hypothetical protein